MMSSLLFSGKMLVGKTAHASKTDRRNLKMPSETSGMYVCVCVFTSINNHDNTSISVSQIFFLFVCFDVIFFFFLESYLALIILFWKLHISSGMNYSGIRFSQMQHNVRINLSI